MFKFIISRSRIRNPTAALQPLLRVEYVGSLLYSWEKWQLSSKLPPKSPLPLVQWSTEVLYLMKAKFWVKYPQKIVWLFVHVLNLLCWTVLSSFLDVQPGQHILDIACGNGLTSRKLAQLNATVAAFDFSTELIKLAEARPNPDSRITYHNIVATDESVLLALGSRSFDSALCNMALFDMADIEPLFHVLPKLLKPNGIFVFSLMHPAFNNPSATLLAEEWDDGQIQTRYAVKVPRYINAFQSQGLALRNQPKPQLYFHRPIRDYMNLAFQNGFVLDGFEERAFPPEHPAQWI